MFPALSARFLTAHSSPVSVIAIALSMAGAIGCGPVTEPDTDSGSDAGTSGGGLSMTLSDHPDSLTADPGDNMLILAYTQGEDTFGLDELLVTWETPGQTATAMNYTLSDDADGDGDFGPGDALTGEEPGLDRVNAGHAGETFEVTLMKELGGNRVETIWSGSWTAD
jgi:hypothetical protein